jgi:hypothetical protein
MDHHEAASFRVGHRKVPPSRSLRSQHWHALSVITPQRPRTPDSDLKQVHSILAAACTRDSAAQHQLLAEAVHPAAAKLLIPSAQTAGCPWKARPAKPSARSQMSRQAVVVPIHRMAHDVTAARGPGGRSCARIHRCARLGPSHKCRDCRTSATGPDIRVPSSHELPIAEVSVRSTCFLASLSVLSNS